MVQCFPYYWPPHPLWTQKLACSHLHIYRSPCWPHALQPEPFLQAISSALTVLSRNHIGSINHLFSKSLVFRSASRPALEHPVFHATPGLRPGQPCTHMLTSLHHAHLTPFIKQHHLLSRNMLGCTISLFLFRYNSSNNLDEITYRGLYWGPNGSTRWWSATDVWYSCIFSHSLPSQIKTIRGGFLSDFCYTMSARLQLEPSSHETKGLKSQGTDWHDGFEHSYQLRWHHSLASWRDDNNNFSPFRNKTSTPPRPQVCEWCFTAPLRFPHPCKTAAGRQTKHQTQQKMWSSLGKISTFQPERANCVPECFELNEACYF